MIQRLIKFLLPVILAIAGINCNGNEEPRYRESGRTLEYTSSVVFLGSDGRELATVDVAVADTPEQRSLGLMDVRSMPMDKGMLFIFEREEPLSFWMANTPLPLDLIFVNRSMQIVRIHHNAQPYSERQFASESPALYVVEVNAGFCINHDITEGHRIRIDSYDNVD